MELKITGVARIAKADMAFNGITVLVGDNNTGKTTVGKVLYSLFNSLKGISERVPTMRLRKLSALFETFVRERVNVFFMDELETLLKAYLTQADGSEKHIRELVKEVAGASCSQEDIDKLLDQMDMVRRISDHEVKEQIVTNVFKQVFADEYMPAKPRDRVGSSVQLTLKNRPFDIGLTPDHVHMGADYSVEHEAYYIDTPDLIEGIVSVGGVSRFWSQGSGLGKQLVREIAKRMLPKDDPGDSAIEDILVNKKLRRILEKIHSVIHGQVAKGKNGRVGYHDEDMGATFKLYNVSRGVRAFALLQTAIQKQVINDNDVLILDEPEIHLHPEWLLDFAEVIVLLQQDLGLTILVTTHSAYFLQALQLLVKQYHCADKLNAYKAIKAEDGNTEITEELHSDDFDSAYISFLMAANKMRRLRDKVMDKMPEM